MFFRSDLNLAKETTDDFLCERLLKLVKIEQNTSYNPANIYLFKINNRNTRKRSEICSKLTIKTPD